MAQQLKVFKRYSSALKAANGAPILRVGYKLLSLIHI